MPAARFAIVLLTLSSLLVAGCVDNGNNTTEPTDTPQPSLTPPPMPAPVTVDVALSGAYPVNIAYDPPRIEVGNNTNITLTFTNNDQNPVANHDWVLDGVEGVATAVIANGESDTIQFLAPPPGTYLFYCSVPGHRGQGMEGEFVVTA